MKQSMETDRGMFNIRTYGNQDDPPLILVHGWPQTSYSWHHMAPYVVGYFIIAPDLRGMGDSNRALDLALYEKTKWRWIYWPTLIQ